MVLILNLGFLVGCGVRKIISKGGAEAFLGGEVGGGGVSGRRETGEEESTEGVDLGHGIWVWWIEEEFLGSGRLRG